MDFQAGMAALKLSAVSFPLAVAPAPRKAEELSRMKVGSVTAQASEPKREFPLPTCPSRLALHGHTATECAMSALSIVQVS